MFIGWAGLSTTHAAFGARILHICMSISVCLLCISTVWVISLYYYFMCLGAAFKFKRSPSQPVRTILLYLQCEDNEDEALSLFRMIYGAIIVLF